MADVFDANRWDSFSEIERKAIENVFNFYVSSKMYEGVIFLGENDGGINFYQKNSKKFWGDISLSESSVEAIKYLVKLGVSGKATLLVINENISGNIFETEAAVEKLHKSGYFSKASAGANSAATFSLTEKGKRYAIDNGFHIWFYRNGLCSLFLLVFVVY